MDMFVAWLICLAVDCYETPMVFPCELFCTTAHRCAYNSYTPVCRQACLDVLSRADETCLVAFYNYAECAYPSACGELDADCAVEADIFSHACGEYL
jgi:hypothetical protein